MEAVLHVVFSLVRKFKKLCVTSLNRKCILIAYILVSAIIVFYLFYWLADFIAQIIPAFQNKNL